MLEFVGGFFNRGIMNRQYLPSNSQKPTLFTINSIEPADPSQLQPEFCRLGDLRKLFGLNRSYAYVLMSEGKIQTVSLRRPGHKFGVRLVHVASVRAYLNGLLKEQANQPITQDESDE